MKRGFLRFCILGSLLFIMSKTADAKTININDKSFPDTYFQEFVSATMDKNGDGKLSDKEREAVKTIDVGDCSEYQLAFEYLPVETLKGIEYFPNLTKLNCSDNLLDKLDVSHNKELVELICNGNSIKNLNISKNEKLKYLSCQDNKIKSLACKNNKALRKLFCDNNHITTLNVSKNKKLRELSVSENKIKKLNVSQLKNLQKLYIDHNKIEKINVSANKKLIALYAHNNKLKKLSVSKNKQLDFLSCSDNKLRKLNLKNNHLLQSLYCENNELITGNLYMPVSGMKNAQVSPQRCQIHVKKTKEGYFVPLRKINKTNVLTNLSEGKITSKGIVIKGNKLPNKLTYEYNMFTDGNTKAKVVLHLKK